MHFKMHLCHMVTDCSNLTQHICPTKREFITAQQQKLMLILCFIWTDWLGEFLRKHQHLGVAY